MRLKHSKLSECVRSAIVFGAVAGVAVAAPAFGGSVSAASDAMAMSVLQQSTTNTAGNNDHTTSGQANPQSQANPQDQNNPPNQNNAQDQNNPQTLQTIVVTGSHIPGVTLETDNPVISVDAQQIKATGKLTAGGVIQQLPVITGGINTPNINNGGGSGSTTVGLRGLGAGRTLILVDGQRVLNKDLNSIPTEAIQSIQVLTSGASAIYGSDAVGGVINIILKSDYNGVQLSYNTGISKHGDGRRQGVGFMFGHSTDKGSILVGGSFQKFDSILQSARDISKSVYGVTVENGRAKKVAGNGSTYAARDFVSVSQDIASRFGCSSAQQLALNQDVFDAGTSPTGPGDYHCFDPSVANDGYNYAAVNYLYTPQQRTNAFFKGDYHLTDSIDLFATYYHDKVSAAFQLAPAVYGTPVQAGTLISKDSYYNPFGVDFNRATGALYRSRMFPVGNRAAKNNNTTDQLIMGIKGKLNIVDRTWNWDIGYNYGHVSTINSLLGLPNTNAIRPGLGPSMLDPATGQVVCVKTPGDLSSVIDGCTPWDPFNLKSDSATKVLASARAPAMINTWSIMRAYHAGANGELFDLPAGTVQMALGIEYRKQYTNNTVGIADRIDPATGTCTLGSQCSAHLQGGFNVKEAYGEVRVPILAGLPGVQALDATIADRYSKYSDVGSTNNWKFGLEWRPFRSLLLRGTVSEVFRAPTIGDVFGAPVSSAPFLSNDPCDYAGTGTNPNADNPACMGVPKTGPFKDNQTPNIQQLQALSSGSKAAGFPLGPETGKSFDFGVVYSPTFASGLTLSADLWRIYLNDTITSVGVQTVMDQCFAGATQFCPLIRRVQSGANAGQIIQMTQPTANLGRLDIKGLDLKMDYKLPQFTLGRFEIRAHATHLKQYKIQTAPGTPSNSVINGAGYMGWFGSEMGSVCPFAAGGLCFLPDWRGKFDLNWQWDHLTADWIMRYISPFKMYPADGQEPGIEGYTNYPSFIYNNFRVAYEIAPAHTTIALGVNNVFNRKPPLLGSGRTLNANTDPEDFDTIGRYYFGSITLNF